MFGFKCLKWDSSAHLNPSMDTFSLPAPIPKWPHGRGFATGRINLGELEVKEVTSFEFIWGSNLSHDKHNGVSFYKPVNIPEGFFSLGYYSQCNGKSLDGYALVVKDLVSPQDSEPNHSPALIKPVDYTLIWNSDDGMGIYDEPGYFWLPESPSGYKTLGFIVTNKPNKPDLNEVRCVREDLTDKCETCGLLLDAYSKFRKIPFKVWKTRPCHRGMLGRGVPVGSFFCSSLWSAGEELQVACLKNLNPNWDAMPDLDQIHALIHHYGPTVFFHPKEIYMPSSVSWFFINGALLFKAGQSNGEPIDAEGSNLPVGGTNDGECWIDLPDDDDRREIIKRGDLQSAELYVHVKPGLGGTFTDIAMWVFSPFNGPGTLKVGPTNIALSRVGEHIGDWEHFTLRVSNFTGKLNSIYFSQHSGGLWVNACDLEFIEGNKAIVYSSKSGHASYPRPGTYLQGSSKIGIGVRNDCGRSNLYVDSSTRYQIVAAGYLGESVVEPRWLQFMREWGPKVVYSSKTELDKIIKRLPFMLRFSVANFFKKFPVELFGQEGATGPKEKNNWVGDERW